MKAGIQYGVAGVTAVSALFVLAGCASDQKAGGHESMAAQGGSHTMGCQMCYDEAVEVRKTYGKPGALTGNRIVRKHMCDGCKGEVVIYAEDGKPMIKCPKCAPEGVACDKCKPPKHGA